MKTLLHNEIIPDLATCVAIGNFDGIHKGHRMLIEHMIECSKNKNIPSIVYTFIGNDKGMGKIFTMDDKVKKFEKINPDYLYFEKFTHEFMSMSAEEFVKKVLATKLKAKHIVVGENFRFGKNASSDVNDLKRICLQKAISVDVLPVLSVNGETVSSTMLRKALSDGNVRKFKSLTDDEYFITGKVIKGKQLGRKLGFPTANIIAEKDMQPLKNGVYSTITIIDSKEYESLTNVGINPTVGGEEKHFETYIDDFCDDIYNKVIKIKFVDFLRCECQFNSLEELKKQIRIDCKTRFNK